MPDLLEQVARAMALIDDPFDEGRAWPIFMAEAQAAIDITLEEAAEAVTREGVGEIFICKLSLNRAVATIRAMKGKADIKNIELAKAGLAGVPYQAYTETSAVKGMKGK